MHAPGIIPKNNCILNSLNFQKFSRHIEKVSLAEIFRTIQIAYCEKQTIS